MSVSYVETNSQARVTGIFPENYKFVMVRDEPRTSRLDKNVRASSKAAEQRRFRLVKGEHNIADMFHMARKYGFTRLDAFILVLTMAIVGSTAFSFFSKTRQAASVSACYANLRQVGGAFETLRIESPDSHADNDRTAAGILRPLSNVMSAPFGLICPNDQRVMASSWSVLSNRNVSYFVNIQVQTGAFGSILAGDRNINVPADSTATLTNVSAGLWSSGKGMHGLRSYVLFGDGHVDELDNSGLSNAVARAPLTTIAVP